MNFKDLRNTFAVAVVGSGILGLGAVDAQVVRQATPVSYSNTLWQDAQSPQAPMSGAQVSSAQVSGCNSCSTGQASPMSCNGGCGGGCGAGGEMDDPWTLFGRNCDSPRLNIGGWFSAGYHAESNDLFNSEPNEFNLHQGWLFVEKAAEAGDCGEIGWGFRFDGMYGIDAGDTQAFGNTVDGFGNPRGWDNGANFQRGGGYGFALPQAYIEMAKGDWTVKAGHFYTLIGYEVVTAPDNFFYSHAITMYNSEPFTHTGVLASYAASENTTYYGGWTAGWDTGFDQFGNGSNFLGGFSSSLSDDVTMTYMTTIGDFGARGSDGYMQSLVFDVAVTDKLQYVLQSDLLRVGSTGEDNFGINQYLIYTMNDRISVGTRAEWWKGDTLTGYAPHGGVVPASGSLSYYETTSGVNIKLHKNLVARPEYRYDWSPGAGYEQGSFGVDFIATY
jgi:hypothetical protein